MNDKEHWIDTDLAELTHFAMGTHPVTGQSWAYCLMCPSGNGPTIEALQAACQRTCSALLYDRWGHTLTVGEYRLQEEERREETPHSTPSRLVDDHGNPL